MVVCKNVTVLSGVPSKKGCTLTEYADSCLEQMPEVFDIVKFDEDKRTYLTKILRCVEG